MAALMTRSGRNPRCLENLLAAGRPFDPVTLPGAPQPSQDLLDQLLLKRLSDARETAKSRGASDADVELLLTGIALLAPPVPIDELAAAHGLLPAQVESFAADLAPLLERTPHGLMFRDEPTETLIRDNFGQSQAGRDRIVAVLLERQATSNYAARSLPALLVSLNDADRLLALAFDLRVPPGATQVSARDIRLSRITAAIALAAILGRRDDLFRLLLEASLVAAGHERSDRLLYEFPDLCAVAGDADSLRRLSATRVGWPGGKHAALALATEFSGDRDEARRHARRAIDWNNWAAQRGGGKDLGEIRASRELDDLGFAYVELLAGNTAGIARFIDQRDEGAAFMKFRGLFGLLDRHMHTLNPPSVDVFKRVARCRLQSRALCAAALDAATFDALALHPARTTRLIKALAAAPARQRSGGALQMACVLGAVRALEHGLNSEAAAILEGAQIVAPPIYVYSSRYPDDSPICVTLLAAGVRAALSRKSAALMDITPAELRALVPQSASFVGPAAFRRVLERKLKPSEHRGAVRRRKRRDGLEEDRRADYSRTFTNRIVPLLTYAQDVADIVRFPKGVARAQAASEALDRLMRQVDGASDYPFKDGKAHLVRAGFPVLLELADVLGLLDAPLATRMVDWIVTAPGLYTPEFTRIVERLSRYSVCHDAAIRLAVHVEARIQLDTDVGSRVSAYGDLARAVWRVSLEEAAAYFRRAIDLAEAIGSDDFDRTNHLLELTGHYRGPELSPQATHTLARIFELNQHEDRKFPWIEYAQSMSSVAGRSMLALLARLDDRDAAQLGYSLGPALTVLVQERKLSADVAVAIAGLAPPGESWTWKLSDLAVSALPRLKAEQKEWFFDLLLTELDRKDQLALGRTTVQALHGLALQSLPSASLARRRIEGLLERSDSRASASESHWERPPAEAVPVYAIDVTDSDDIDRQLNADRDGETGQVWAGRTLGHLAAQVTTPAQRLGFVRAVVEAAVPSLSEKLQVLGDRIQGWSKTSAAMRDALPLLAQRLAERHAAELAGSGFEASGGWRDLEQKFGVAAPHLVEYIIQSLRPGMERVDGNGWLALAAKLASGVDASAMAQGLERFLKSSSEKLPGEVGDGPWHSYFECPAGEADFIAGLVWARLGHPVAAMRWRAAHAVRRLAQVGRTDAIDRLIARLPSADASPFADWKLPFFGMHAKLWLLMALERLAKDSPQVLVPHRATFEAMALSSDFPHVVMRAVAIDLLETLGPSLPSDVRKAMSQRLDGANLSPFPHAPQTRVGELMYAPRPKGTERPSSDFHLDYDFRRYQAERLCRVFGCPGWEVEDRIGAWVRDWDAQVQGMYDCTRSPQGTYDESWSSGFVPTRDRYGGYLAWHALMLVAGQMLKTLSVVESDWDGDAWAGFLAEYRLSRSDGLWLSDLTDPFPLDLPDDSSLPMPAAGEQRTSREDAALLAPLLGIQGSEGLADWIPVNGRWSVGRGTDATLQSVLADANHAKALAMTWLSSEPFFRWMPDDEEGIERNFGRNDHTVQSWLVKPSHPERQFDRHDPYAASTALDRRAPSGVVRDLLGLTADDEAPRRWSVQGAPAFLAQAWGAEGGGATTLGPRRGTACS
ncbi:hypothetical protein ACQ86G_08460 [Roseateles chitinivorans]|uniref:hypothetical protein n=1 Tax=Roseateles chitinivorans TaxID=2917965 RepID=UPI003D670627